VIDVEVERQAQGLLVRWTLEEGPGGADGRGPVVVCVGEHPDAIDHARPVAVVSEGRRVLLRGLDPGVRHYVHVAVGGEAGVVAAERLLPFEGTLNFRDLGGYRGRGGRRVRWGVVFRSDALSELTDADLRLVSRLGLRVVHDFRWDDERQRAPSRLPADAGLRAVVRTIGSPPAEQADVLDLVMAGRMDDLGVDFMVGLYREMLAESAPTFGALLTSLAQPGQLPALFHCTAGKDRTGIAAALLLGLLGVPDDTVLDDYELSTRYRSNRRISELRPRLEAAGVDVERVRPFLSAQREVMETSLRELEAEHGSMLGYLTGPAGVSGPTIDRLRRLLLEEHPRRAETPGQSLGPQRSSRGRH
jgi:protein-tyrosine phosphatase